MARIKLGVIASLAEGAEKALEKVREQDFPTCQLVCWDMSLYTQKNAELVKKAMKKNRVEITTLWAGTPGTYVWNFIEGPPTIGIVPRGRRRARVAALKNGSDFARKCGIPSIATHVGFIPEDPNDILYSETVAAVREVASHCRKNGQQFWFETGQETPVTLLRTIEDAGLNNLGVNLDTANVMLYGKGNPVDALDTIGKYVRGLHAKDGFYPTDGRSLGREVAIGEGKADFPAIVKKLKSLGFIGAITIEREISGPQQIRDIRKARLFLEKLIRS